jgi:hypothetical protein
MSIILVCWIAKIVILPVTKVLKRGGVVDEPHDLTAITFALIAVICGAILGAIRTFCQ